jgi:hypothetical protein
MVPSTSTSGHSRQKASSPTGSRPFPGKGWFSLLRLYGPLDPWFGSISAKWVYLAKGVSGGFG